MKKAMLVGATWFALVLSGCGGTAPVSSSDAKPEATSTPSAVVESPGVATPAEEAATPTEEPAGEEASDEPIPFAKTVSFEDGLEMTVSAPAAFKPSEYAAGIDGAGTAVRFQVTIKNATGKTIDPSGFYATVSSGEAEAQSIFDSEKGLEGSPSTKVLNGKSVKFNIAYKVLNIKDITMEVNPGMFEYADTIYTNNV